MIFKVVQTLLVYVSVYVVAFDDILVASQEMVEQGRTQYQLLREKGNLPRYGTCWKSALDRVEDGCRNLSEDTQSDMALHLTNCFLEMSGHETYNCELDIKPNLRSICINSMSDRAFNVYTEFYTHVQNICWFLRGQIWYETISESSYKVGRQLELSAMNQAELLNAQKESIQVQNDILKHEKLLDEVLGDLYVSAKAHQDVLRVLTKSVARFQAWVVGEVSWLDSVVFYFISILVVFIVSAAKRTRSARLPLLLLLLFNFMVERFICFLLIDEESLVDTKDLYQSLYSYVWYCRDFFIFLIVVYLIYHLYSYVDVVRENNTILRVLVEQNCRILTLLNSLTNNNSCNNVKLICSSNDTFDSVNETRGSNGFLKACTPDLDDNRSVSAYLASVKCRKTYSKASFNFSDTLNRYNLRSSKQNTPDLK